MVLDRTDSKDSQLQTPLQHSLSLWQEIAGIFMERLVVYTDYCVLHVFGRHSDAIILIWLNVFFFQDVGKTLLLFYFYEVCYLSTGGD